MAAYLIAQIQVHDPEAYKNYSSRTPAIIAKHGGRFLARGGATEILEGDPLAGRIVIIEFPTMDAARSFFNSPEYQQVRKFRTPVSEAQFLIVQGVD
jgi:uncharacterized protein (DUF1330 family)